MTRPNDPRWKAAAYPIEVARKRELARANLRKAMMIRLQNALMRDKDAIVGGVEDYLRESGSTGDSRGMAGMFLKLVTDPQFIARMVDAGLLGILDMATPLPYLSWSDLGDTLIPKLTDALDRDYPGARVFHSGAPGRDSMTLLVHWDDPPGDPYDVEAQVDRIAEGLVEAYCRAVGVPKAMTQATENSAPGRLDISLTISYPRGPRPITVP